MDNHDSHISISTQKQKGQEVGIILITIPPHTSHKLQSLDHTVFRPYKTYGNEWMILHPGQPTTLHDVAEVTGNAFYKVFKVTGIYPVNENVF